MEKLEEKRFQYLENIPDLYGIDRVGGWRGNVDGSNKYLLFDLYLKNNEFYLEYDFCSYERCGIEKFYMPYSLEMPKGKYKLHSKEVVEEVYKRISQDGLQRQDLHYEYYHDSIYSYKEMNDDYFDNTLKDIIKYENENREDNDIKKVILKVKYEKNFDEILDYLKTNIEANTEAINNINKVKKYFADENEYKNVINKINEYNNYLKKLNDILIYIKLDDEIAKNNKPKEKYNNRWTSYAVNNNIDNFDWIADLETGETIIYKDNSFYIYNKKEYSINPKGLYMIDSITVLDNLISSTKVKDEDKFNKYKKTLPNVRKTLIKYDDLVNKIKEYEESIIGEDKDFDTNIFNEIVLNRDFKSIDKLLKESNDTINIYNSSCNYYLTKQEKENIINKINLFVTYLNNIKEIMKLSYYSNGCDEEFDINTFICRWENNKEKTIKK